MKLLVVGAKETNELVNGGTMAATADEIAIPLPSWDDDASVTSYLVSLAAVAFGIVGSVHPGFAEPSWVPDALTSVAAIVAGGVQLANIVSHVKAKAATVTNVSVAALAAGRSVVIRKAA